ncbi:MAG: ATP-binding protein [Candidatus Odinarchaeota archaeon]|nr:ATP-binding protein [Candidatus Odinarchaeota archaeon]
MSEHSHTQQGNVHNSSTTIVSTRISSQRLQNYIGRVAITQKEPTTPQDFWAWINPAEELTVGSLVIAEDPNIPDSRILAVVDNAKSTSRMESLEQEFFSHDFGNPNAQVSTIPTVIKAVHCQIINRERPMLVPLSSRYLIRRASINDIQDLLASNIASGNRILAGFVKICDDETNPRCWAPVYYHSDFILGPEGAHMNISGITGLATKTSYAILLAYSILSWARDNDERVAIVMFNVKRRDLIDLHNLPPDWSTAENDIRSWGSKRGLQQNVIDRNIALWQAMRNAGVDPLSLLPQVRIFTFSRDPDLQYINTVVQETNGHQNYVNLQANTYSYGFLDLTRDEIIAAIGRELTEPMMAIIDRFLEEVHTQVQQGRAPPAYTCNINNQSVRVPADSFENWYRIFYHCYGTSTEERRSARAVARRLRAFLARSTHVIERSRPHGDPIRVVTRQQPNIIGIDEGINVIQLYRLSDDEKRVVVNAVLRRVTEALEAGEANFTRAVFFIDELNKYAPREKSPIKELIVDIAARGRDLMLSLIGAEQFASRIDVEIYENCSTKVVGRSGTAELSEPIYKYLLGFKDYATMLEKGQMVIYHPPLVIPLIVSFPIPLHETRRP